MKTDAAEIRAQLNSTLRAELARRQLHQGHVAEALGIARSGVSDRLTGKVPWTVEELVALADLCDMDVRDLIPASAAIRSNAWMNGSDDLDLADDSANVVGADFGPGVLGDGPQLLDHRGSHRRHLPRGLSREQLAVAAGRPRKNP